MAISLINLIAIHYLSEIQRVIIFLWVERFIICFIEMGGVHGRSIYDFAFIVESRYLDDRRKHPLAV